MKKAAVIFNSQVLHYLLLLVFITSGSWMAKAQSPERPRSTDVVLKGVKLVERTSTQSKINYFVMLDMTGYESAKKLYLSLGRTPEASDMGSSVGIFKEESSKIYIKYQGEDYQQCDGSIGVIMDIPKAFFPELKNLTVYIEDNSGRISNKIHVQSF
jgi:hypothetical protein